MENKTVKINIPSWIKNLKLIFHPIYWSFMLNEFDPKWDIELNELIDGGIAKLDRPNSIDGEHYFIIFNNDKNCKVWISNYPYAYGADWRNPIGHSIRPSKSTILRLRQLENKLKNQK